MAQTARVTVFGTGQSHSSRAGQVADSTPRPARTRFIVDVTGAGESRLTGSKALQFGSLMLDEPSFSFGVIATKPIPFGAMPLATAIVLKYIRNENKLWVGAEVGFSVQSYDPKIKLQFSLTFEAITLRSVANPSTAAGQIAGTPNTFRGIS